MNPPAEQLVRDYLRALAIAANRRLGHAERRRLLERTSARIEAESGGVAHASVEQVIKVLAGLGEPIALVEAEYEQVTADRQAADGVRQVSLVPQQAPSPESPHGPYLAPSLPELQSAALSAQPALPGNAVPLDSVAPAAADGASTPGGPGQAADDPADAAGFTAEPEQVGISLLTELEIEPGRLGDAARAAASFLARMVLEVGTLARRHMLETVAVALMGIGGAVYPPIWILGAILALPSRVWDIRDKWFGIVLPVLLVVVGAVLVLAFGGQRPLGAYPAEAWVAASRLSRVMSVLGAAYLLWRLRSGRRKPKLPPWNVPHKLG